MRECSHESRGRNSSEWPRSSIRLWRTADALDRGTFVYLPIVDGASVLVAVVFLDRGRFGWRANVTDIASMDRADFLCVRVKDVFEVVAPDAQHGSRQAMVALAETLYSE